MQNVIENFKNLCKIPHCSYQTEQMKEFLSSYAKGESHSLIEASASQLKPSNLS
ncbi:hypothetical protein MK771_001710 [Campylobacter coli]|nr:hypothetical protein [Campylobacter coli]EJA3597033.1 hypothetical protein [Campylobacter coli]EJJ0066509.1 hypothetical protein [Campylobacter coli]